jgi:hypothetical protein
VVLATGVQFGTVVVENIIGKDFVDKLGGLGSLDEEGERLGVSVFQYRERCADLNSGGGRPSLPGFGICQAPSSGHDSSPGFLRFRSMLLRKDSMMGIIRRMTLWP